MIGQRESKPSWKEFILNSSSLDILRAGYSSFAPSPTRFIIALLFCSMPCDVTPMHCIAQAPLPWPSVGFVQWEALVGDPKAGGEREDGALTTSLPVFCLIVLHGCTSCQTAPLHLPSPAQVLVKAFSPLTAQCAFVFSLLLSPGYSTGSFMVPRTLSISLVNSLFNSLQLKTFK